MDRKGPAAMMWLVCVIVGIAGLNRVMSSPAYAVYRGVDVVQLLGSGACFGVAMMGVIFTLVKRIRR